MAEVSGRGADGIDGATRVLSSVEKGELSFLPWSISERLDAARLSSISLDWLSTTSGDGEDTGEVETS